MSCGCEGFIQFGARPLRGEVSLVRGTDLGPQNLTLVTDAVSQTPKPWPAGSLSMELATLPVKTVWPFTIAGSVASLKVESEEVDKVPDRTDFVVKWLPAGELAGGQAVVIGKVRVCR